MVYFVDFDTIFYVSYQLVEPCASLMIRVMCPTLLSKCYLMQSFTDGNVTSIVCRLRLLTLLPSHVIDPVRGKGSRGLALIHMYQIYLTLTSAI